MDTNGQKGLCAMLLVLDTLLFGWLPFLITRRGMDNPRHARLRAIAISHFNSFAGGVFLGVCLLGILVEGREVMEEYMVQSKTTTELPVYEVLIAAGFFLIATAEKLAHQLLHSTQALGKDKALEMNDILATVNGQLQREDAEHGDSNPDNMEYGTLPECRAGRSCRSCGTQTWDVALVKSNGHKPAPPPEDHAEATVQTIADADPLGAFLLLCAFSFHTVFDGLAVGLKETDREVWEMFSGILAHKSLVSLCLGFQFFHVYKDKPRWAFFWIFLLSLVAPIGLGVGISILDSSMDEVGKNLASGILQGIATGTFLYVTCFEILHPDVIVKSGYLRLFLAIVGFSTMLSIQAIPWS